MGSGTSIINPLSGRLKVIRGLSLFFGLLFSLVGALAVASIWVQLTSEELRMQESTEQMVPIWSTIVFAAATCVNAILGLLAFFMRKRQKATVVQKLFGFSLALHLLYLPALLVSSIKMISLFPIILITTGIWIFLTASHPLAVPPLPEQPPAPTEPEVEPETEEA